jgi:MinD superfamily P-loop ATPase
MMMHIHLIGGEKGGVGKTFVSRCLVQYFLLKKWDFDLIEADAAIGDVSSGEHVTLAMSINT